MYSPNATPRAVFNDRSPSTPPPIFHPTPCCAVHWLSAKDGTLPEHLGLEIERLRRESRHSYGPEDSGGQRSAICIVSPGEDQLRRNLQDLRFKMLSELPRRHGYPEGKLEMWMLSW
jgi:hypothetical protein